jgi:hypothetical protein
MVSLWGWVVSWTSLPAYKEKKRASGRSGQANHWSSVGTYALGPFPVVIRNFLSCMSRKETPYHPFFLHRIFPPPDFWQSACRVMDVQFHRPRRWINILYTWHCPRSFKCLPCSSHNLDLLNRIASRHCAPKFEWSLFDDRLRDRFRWDELFGCTRAVFSFDYLRLERVPCWQPYRESVVAPGSYY